MLNIDPKQARWGKSLFPGMSVSQESNCEKQGEVLCFGHYSGYTVVLRSGSHSSLRVKNWGFITLHTLMLKRVVCL